MSVFLLARIVSAALQLVFVSFLAKSVPVAEFGQYFSALAVAGIVCTLSGFGFNNRALRLGAEENARHVESAMLLFRSGSVGISCAVSLAYMLLLGNDSGVLVIAALTFTFSEQLTELTQAILLGRGQQGLASVAIVVRRLVPVAAILLWPSSSSAFGSIAASSVVVVVVSLAMNGRRFSRPIPVRQLIGSSTPYWYASLAGSLQQLDLVVVRALFGDDTAGLYAAASRLLAPLGLVTSSLVSVFIPTLSREPDPGARLRLLRTVRRYMAAYAGLLVLASPAVYFLAPLLLGQGYAGSHGLFVSVAVAAAINALAQSSIAYLYAVGRPKMVAIGVLIVSVSTLSGIAVAGLVSEFWLVVTVPPLAQILSLLYLRKSERGVAG